MSEDKSLADYIKKLLELQQDFEKQTPSSEELKKIALDLGLDENQWQDIQKIADNYVKNGLVFLQHENWQDALEEFDKALEINPYHKDALLGRIKAYRGLYFETKKSIYKNELEKHVQKILKVETGHPEAIKILSEVENSSKRKKISSSLKKSNHALPLIVAVAITFIFLFITLMPSSNSKKSDNANEQKSEEEFQEKQGESEKQQLYNEIIDKREIVYRQWAQVENVYQRRSDLIREVLDILEKSGKLEKQLMDKILRNQDELKQMEVNHTKGSDMKRFREKQDELAKQLKKITIGIQESSTLKGYRDLQTQIEGSENRITVERKRYNEAVAEYNAMIQKYPYNQFEEFEKMVYFKSE